MGCGTASYPSTLRQLFGALGLGSECCFRVREQSVPAGASSVEVNRKTATAMGWDTVPNDLNEHVGSLDVRCFWKRQPSVPSSETIAVGVISKKPTPTTWDSLPNDLQANVLQRVNFRDLSRFKTLSKSSKEFIESEAFRQSRGGISDLEGVLAAINYCNKNRSWRCSRYDLHSRSWRSLPRMSHLPSPDAELFKEYSVCGHGGFMRAEVSKSPTKGELVVFNPLTGESRTLPPLLHLRNPVLVHISVDFDKKFYKVIVAGNSSGSDEHLSRKMEVFDSSTSKWKEVSDLRGPASGLNGHQAGVCLNGKLFFIAYMEGGGRGVVAFDLQEEKWLPDLATPIPWSSASNTLQLFVIDKKLFLFSEQQQDQCVGDHCIDELEFQNPKAGTLTCRSRSFVKEKKSGGRGLQVYPEHTCVNFTLEKLSIFNPLSKKLLNYLLPLCVATMPSGACAGQKSRMDSLSGMWTPSNARESPEFAKNAAVTLLVGITMIGGRVAWRIFRRRQARGNRFNIDGGLKKETPNPRSREAERAIPPVIPV